MAKTYREIEKQIKALQAEAEQMRQAGRKDAINKIRAAVLEYDLHPNDIFGRSASKTSGLRGRPGRPAATVSGTESSRSAPRAASRSKGTLAGSKVPPKYRNASTGDTWTGRGSQPRWIREAMSQGKKMEDFLI